MAKYTFRNADEARQALTAPDPEARVAAEEYLNSPEAKASDKAKQDVAETKTKGPVAKTATGKAAWWEEPYDQKEAEKKLEETQKYTDTHLEGVIQGQDNIAKGNLGENKVGVKDWETIDAARKAAAEQGIESLNIPGKVSEIPTTGEIDKEAIDKGEAISNANVVANTPSQTPIEQKAKNKYKYQSRSIWDAYYNGDFGEPGSEEAKNTRNYFIIDAVANFAKNLGRNVGNIGAQYSGGTIDNNEDVSKWSQVQDTLGKEELGVEKETGLAGHASRLAKSEQLQNTLTQLSTNRASTINDLIEAMQADVAKMDDSNPLKTAYLSLIASMANGNVDGTTTLAATGAKSISSLIDWVMGKNGE